VSTLYLTARRTQLFLCPQLYSRRIGSGRRVVTPVPGTGWAPPQPVLVPGACFGDYVRRRPVHVWTNFIREGLGSVPGSTGTCVPSKPTVLIREIHLPTEAHEFQVHLIPALFMDPAGYPMLSFIDGIFHVMSAFI
jgi:hypothetical protein